METVSGDAEFLPGVSFIQTPGHTPGSMSMRVDLARHRHDDLHLGRVYMGESYGPPSVPAAIVNNLEQWYASVEKLRGIAEETDATVVFGHDPDQIRQLRVAPTGSYTMSADAGAGSSTEETIFTWGAPPLKFGAGAIDEIGFELTQYDVRPRPDHHRPDRQRAPASRTGSPTSSPRHDIASEVFDGVHVEPTDDSMDKAAGYAREQGPWDGFVAVGGGSAIDTAKAVNLMTTDGGELMDYLNKPIGKATAPRGQLKPLIAVPTTAGHRLGEHRDVRARRAVDEGEDRHQPLAAAPDARGRRPAADA